MPNSQSRRHQQSVFKTMLQPSTEAPPDALATAMPQADTSQTRSAPCESGPDTSSVLPEAQNHLFVTVATTIGHKRTTSDVAPDLTKPVAHVLFHHGSSAPIAASSLAAAPATAAVHEGTRNLRPRGIQKSVASSDQTIVLDASDEEDTAAVGAVAVVIKVEFSSSPIYLIWSSFFMFTICLCISDT